MQCVVLPTLGVVAFLGLLIVSFLYMATSSSDELALKHQQQLVELSLRQSAARLINDQEASTIWDDAIEHLRQRPLDLEWIDNNLGIWFYTFYGHDEVYILSPRNDAIYAMQSGARVPPGSFRGVSNNVLPLTRQLRLRLRSGHFAPESSDGQTIGAWDRGILNGRPAIVSVKPVVSETGSLPQTPGEEYLHVSVRYLDGSFLAQLTDDFGVKKARFSWTESASGSVPITDHSGKAIGHLAWDAFSPGQSVRQKMLPVLGAALALIGIVLSWLLHRIWSSRIALEASRSRAQHLAFHDALTSLPNRASFDNRLEHVLTRQRDGHASVILLDLDRFKNVNDTLGHQAGDALIREFGARLTKLVRQEDTVARLGGDEFALLIEGATPNELSDLCERILQAAQLPFEVPGSEAFVGVSAGVAHYCKQGESPTEILRRADIALYRAKGEGGNVIRVFDYWMDESVKRRGMIEDQLRAAIISGEGLRVHYQPEISGRTGEAVGFEALVRWEHPTEGLLTPEHFISVAEETGLIIPLGEWVLAQASKTSACWPHLFMAVNLSPLHFKSENLVERLSLIVRQNGGNPKNIQLEVTERLLLDDTDTVQATIAALRSAGFGIVLDDFGTGYSSLSYLKKFAVDKIKIDQSFIRNLNLKDESASIILAVLALGRAMGLTVTAEGVETKEQREFLVAAGCTELQGYFFSKPVPFDQIDAVLRRASRWEVAA